MDVHSEQHLCVRDRSPQIPPRVVGGAELSLGPSPRFHPLLGLGSLAENGRKGPKLGCVQSPQPVASVGIRSVCLASPSTEQNHLRAFPRSKSGRGLTVRFERSFSVKCFSTVLECTFATLALLLSREAARLPAQSFIPGGDILLLPGSMDLRHAPELFGHRPGLSWSRNDRPG